MEEVSELWDNMESGGEEEEEEEEKNMDPGVMEAKSDELRLVLIGRTGGGKSASGNTMLGRKHFLSQVSASSVTRVCQLGSAALAKEEGAEPEEDGSPKRRRRRRRVTVVDLPGFGDTHLSAEQIHTEVARCVCLCAPGPHAFLLVVPIGRYTDDENRAVSEMTRIFGEAAVRQHTVLLFTRGDELEGLGMEEYLSTATPGLRALIDRCGGRYHVFNNKEPDNTAQVAELLVKVDAMVREAGFYTNRMFEEVEAAIREEEEEEEEEGGATREEGEGEEGNKMEDVVLCAKRRKCDLECEVAGSRGGAEEEMRVERWTEESRGGALSLLRDRARQYYRERIRGRQRGGGGGGGGSGRPTSRRRSLLASRQLALLSPKVLERVKILVAAGATGMAVGAVLGAAAPLAAAAGASLMGNSVGFAASQLAGMSVAGGSVVGKAVGAIVAAATGKSAVALGAATGGVVGGSVGAVVGAGAASPAEGAAEALGHVGVLGAAAVGVAAGVGGGLGAGAALGAALEGSAVGLASAAGAAAPVAPVAPAAPQCVAALAPAAAESATSAVACPAVGGAVVSDHWGSVAATTRILSAVAEIGKAAAGVALAGGLVVKVVKEKIRCGTATTETSYSEKKSYEIYWNK